MSYEDGVAVGTHGCKFSFKEEEQGYFTTDTAKFFYGRESKNMTYRPLQFHFHSGVNHANVDDMGSEHTYNGEHYPLELHIVHSNDDEDTQDWFKYAVVGVMFTAEDTDDLSFADDFLRRLWSGETVDTQTEFMDHLELFHRFVYRGSLTTPPYSEFLHWNMNVMTVPINYETLKLFRHKLPLEDGEESVMWGEPNRDVQELNGRRIFEVCGSDWEYCPDYWGEEEE